MTVVVSSAEDFTLEAFRRVTVDGEDVAVGPTALRAMADARAGFEQLLRSDPHGFIYGVTRLEVAGRGVSTPQVRIASSVR